MASSWAAGLESSGSGVLQCARRALCWLSLLSPLYAKPSLCCHANTPALLFSAATPAPLLPAAMGIPVDFQQTHSSLCLHIWLLLVRLRAEGKDGKQLAQVRGAGSSSMGRQPLQAWGMVAACDCRQRAGRWAGRCTPARDTNHSVLAPC